VSVPSSEFGPPTPSPASECVLPPGSKGVSKTRLRVRGWADPIWTTGENAWHSVYSVHVRIFRSWNLEIWKFLLHTAYERTVHNTVCLKWMRSSQAVRASDSQCRSRNYPGFDSSPILRCSGIWGVVDKAQCWIKYCKKIRKNPYK
jgi:hypothetical protein